MFAVSIAVNKQKEVKKAEAPVTLSPDELNKASTIFNEIQKFNGKIENDEFDCKERSGKRIDTYDFIRHIHGFLNGNKEEGYIIVGFKDNNSTFDLREHSLIKSAKIKEKGKEKEKSSEQRTSQFKREIFNRLKKHTTNWPDEEQIISRLVDITPIPIMLVNDIPTVTPNLKDNDGYIIVIKIYQSPLRPHAFQAKIEERNTPSTIYYIRRKEQSSGSKIDGCTGHMTPKEIETQISERIYRRERKDENPYIIYGESPQYLFDQIYIGSTTEKVKDLLDRFPGLITTRDASGASPLHYAISYNRNDIARLLIKEYDVSLYSADDEGSTPLLLCAMSDNVEMFDYIVNIDGSTIYQKDRLGGNIFLNCCVYSKPDSMKLLTYLYDTYRCKREVLAARSYEGWGGLQEAVYSPSICVVRFLLNKENFSKKDLFDALKIAEDYKESSETDEDEEIKKRCDDYKQIEDLLLEKIRENERNMDNSSSSASSSSSVLPPLVQPSQASDDRNHQIEEIQTKIQAVRILYDSIYNMIDLIQNKADKDYIVKFESDQILYLNFYSKEEGKQQIEKKIPILLRELQIVEDSLIRIRASIDDGEQPSFVPSQSHWSPPSSSFLHFHVPTTMQDAQLDEKKREEKKHH